MSSEREPPPCDAHPGMQRMTLDVTLEGECVHGVLRADGTDQPFDGWLSLIGAIDRALRTG